MNTASLGLTLDEHDEIRLWASRSAEWACLVLDAGGMYCEVQLSPVHLAALRDQLPAVLAGLARQAADEAGCVRAELAERQAVDTTALALDLAATADQAGARDLAASLRAAAAEATTRATAVDDQVRAFTEATTEADHAVEKLVYAMNEAGTALRENGAYAIPSRANGSTSSRSS